MSTSTGHDPNASGAGAGDEPAVPPDHPSHHSQRLPGIVTAAILAGLLIFLLAGMVTMEIPPGATSPGPLVFPVIVASLTGALLIAQLIALFRPVKASMKGDMSPGAKQVTDEPEIEAEEAEHAPGVPDDSVNGKVVLGVVGSVAVFIAILQPVGWLISAALLFAGIGFAMGERKLRTLAAAGLAISSLIQLGFGGGLGLSLPAGILSGVF